MSNIDKYQKEYDLLKAKHMKKAEELRKKYRKLSETKRYGSRDIPEIEANYREFEDAVIALQKKYGIS